MQRFLYATLLSLAFATLACGELVNEGINDDVPTIDGGGDVGTCTPECGENAICNAQDTCECSAAFEGDGQICEDIDECAAGNGGCDNNALCINTPGARTCVCNANFTGDGETCSEIWSLVGTLGGVNLDPKGFGTIAAFADGEVFFGPITNTLADAFMRSFAIGTGQFSGPLPLPPQGPGDFCACGFGESFVSNGAELFLLGNSGMRYTPDLQRWATFTPYVSPNRRGEAGSTFDSSTNSILMFGGRDNQTNALRFDLDDGALTGVEPGTPPVSIDRAAAHSLPNSPVSFIANPVNGGGVEMLSHETGTPTWIQHTSAPNDINGPETMGYIGQQIWLADRSGVMFFYDPMADTWSDTRLEAPVGTEVVVQAGGDVVAIAQSGGDAQVWRLVTQP